MAQLATQLGSSGVRFGHLMHSRLTTARGFDLSPEERVAVEREIWSLQSEFPIAIAMGPGYHTNSLFPCTPLQMREINIDCRGNVTKCCHLSSHGDGAGQGDVVGNLRDISFGEAVRRLVAANDQFRVEKLHRQASGALSSSDLFPCWYCSLYFEKVDWLQKLPDHPWTSLKWNGVSGRSAPVARPAS
jgi:MoaA/NifB/PqqE/SkfB family radical SAM enzyme